MSAIAVVLRNSPPRNELKTYDKPWLTNSTSPRVPRSRSPPRGRGVCIAGERHERRQRRQQDPVDETNILVVDDEDGMTPIFPIPETASILRTLKNPTIPFSTQ